MKFKLLTAFALIFVFGCSSHYKKRQEQREKVSASSGLFCEFLSGDEHTDVDVELNLQMAKRCDITKQYSVTNYKNASDNFGVIYCCQIQKKDPTAAKKENSSTKTPAAPTTGGSSPQNAPVSNNNETLE